MMDFAAEAERRRRAGDAHAALAIAEEGLAADPANHPGRVALALALLDLGDFQRAREQLEMAVPGAPEAASGMMPSESGSLGDDLGEDELESAFAHAETNPDEMLSANKVVEQTLAMRAGNHENDGTLELAADRAILAAVARVLHDWTPSTGLIDTAEDDEYGEASGF